MIFAVQKKKMLWERGAAGSKEDCFEEI